MGPPSAVFWVGKRASGAYNALVGWGDGLEAMHGDFWGPRLALGYGSAGGWPSFYAFDYSKARPYYQNEKRRSFLLAEICTAPYYELRATSRSSRHGARGALTAVPCACAR